MYERIRSPHGLKQCHVVLSAYPRDNSPQPPPLLRILRSKMVGNLVPRVLSLLLPRESTLVAAGHVSMYTNQIRTRGGSLIYLCQNCLWWRKLLCPRRRYFES